MILVLSNSSTITKNEKNPRIINGNRAGALNWPWHVGLRGFDNNE